MTETMGQIIRRLRKEKNLTQEELAEQLNVSNQAVSKWECGDGLPDISQVVPLANVFGVSTDVLFGVEGTNSTEEAYRIIREAQAVQQYGKLDTYIAAYDKVIEGLRKYPNNLVLLNNCVGLGLSLCLPENGWIYALKRADEIAAETERQAKLIITYSKNVSDIMRAHQVLLFLYSSRGEYGKAAAEAENFPERTDFTLHSNVARVDEAKGDWENVIKHLGVENTYALQSLEDNIARLGKAYFGSGRYRESVEIYEMWFSVMKALFGEEFPAFHDFDSGDMFILLAQAYLAMGDYEKAMQNTESAVMYYLNFISPEKKIRIDNLSDRLNSPLLGHGVTGTNLTIASIKKGLTEKLASPELDPLRETERFKLLEAKVAALK